MRSRRDLLGRRRLQILDRLGGNRGWLRELSAYYRGLTIQELWEDRLAITAGDTPWSLRCLPMNHPTCIGYRIEAEGASLVYSGDTDVCENIVKLARHADVLILECSFHDDEKVEGHLTPAEAGAIANRAECRTLLLTHFYPGTDAQACVEQCRKLCEAEVLAAYDGLRLRLGA